MIPEQNNGRSATFVLDAPNVASSPQVAALEGPFTNGIPDAGRRRAAFGWYAD
jgi:hypothetical protein